MFKGRLIVPAVFATVVLGATACAAQGPLYRYPAGPRQQVDNRAYRNGYEVGRAQGNSDARRGRSFDYQRHGEYRNAVQGYDGYGSRNDYRALFREGFVDGYNSGYRVNNRGGNGYPSGPGPYVYGGGGSSAPRVYRSAAGENGYRDGYEQGAKDARDRHAFDPVRAKDYRKGDPGYNDRYGSRDEYKREYRTAFERGYSEGYRLARR